MININKSKGRVFIAVYCILSFITPNVSASFYRNIGYNTPVYISNFVIMEEGETLQCRFSLKDANQAYTRAAGTVSITIFDSTDKIVYSDAHSISTSDFGKYTLVLTGAEFEAHVWTIPISAIDKGTGYGRAELTFSTSSSRWEIDTDFVTIPTYTSEELAEHYESKYQETKKIIGETIRLEPFEVTLESVGQYQTQYYGLGEVTEYFRVDLIVKNIASTSEYFYSYPVLIDNFYNQYDWGYGGTFEGGNLYPEVIRKGSLLYPKLNEELETLRIILSISSYPNNIVYEFTLDSEQIGILKPSTISLTTSDSRIETDTDIVLSGTIDPSVSYEEVMLQFIVPSGQILTRNVTTDSGGIYSFTGAPNTAGDWSVSASWEGNELFKGATSRTVSFSVVDPPPPPEPEPEKPTSTETTDDTTSQGIPGFPIISIVFGLCLFIYSRKIF